MRVSREARVLLALVFVAAAAWVWINYFSQSRQDFTLPPVSANSLSETLPDATADATVSAPAAPAVDLPETALLEAVPSEAALPEADPSRTTSAPPPAPLDGVGSAPAGADDGSAESVAAGNGTVENGMVGVGDGVGSAGGNGGVASDSAAPNSSQAESDAAARAALDGTDSNGTVGGTASLAANGDESVPADETAQSGRDADPSSTQEATTAQPELPLPVVNSALVSSADDRVTSVTPDVTSDPAAEALAVEPAASDGVEIQAATVEVGAVGVGAVEGVAVESVAQNADAASASAPQVDISTADTSISETAQAEGAQTEDGLVEGAQTDSLQTGRGEAFTVAPDGPLTARDVEVAELPFLVTTPPALETPAQAAPELAPTRPGGGLRATVNPFSPILLAPPEQPQTQVLAAPGDAPGNASFSLAPPSTPSGIVDVPIPDAPVAGSSASPSTGVGAEAGVPTRVTAPAPQVLTPPTTVTAALPRPLPGGTLPATPDLLRTPRRAAEPAVATTPEVAPLVELAALRLPGGAASPNFAAAAPPALQQAELGEAEPLQLAGTPGRDPVLGNPIAAGTSGLTRFLRDGNYRFTGYVISAVGVGVFRSNETAAPVVVTLGQTIPGTDVVLTSLKGEQAELTLDDEKQVLILNPGG